MSSWIRDGERGGRHRERKRERERERGEGDWCSHCSLWTSVATDGTLYLHEARAACVLRNSRRSSSKKIPRMAFSIRLTVIIFSQRLGPPSNTSPCAVMSHWFHLFFFFGLFFVSPIWLNKFLTRKEVGPVKRKQGTCSRMRGRKKRSREAVWYQTFKESNLLQIRDSWEAI